MEDVPFEVWCTQWRLDHTGWRNIVRSLNKSFRDNVYTNVTSLVLSPENSKSTTTLPLDLFVKCPMLVRLVFTNSGVCDLTPLTALKHTLEHLDMSGNTNCKGLWTSGSREENTLMFDLMPVGALTKLKHLDLHGSCVFDIAPLSALTSLEHLVCSRTHISDLDPLTGLVRLKRLDLEGLHRVLKLGPISALTSLEHLSITDSLYITDLTPLTTLKRLQRFECYGTYVADIAPLAALSSLRGLNIGLCKVASVAPLAALTSLTYVDCRHNHVADLSPLGALVQLEHLDFRGGCRGRTGMAHLTALTSLRRITCSRVDFTETSKLAAMLPQIITVVVKEL